MTTLYLIRHAESVANARNLLAGRVDFDHGLVRLPQLNLDEATAKRIKKIIITASGGPFRTADLATFLKQLAAAAGGRGGGRPEHAEGRLPPGTDFPALVASLLG